MTKLENGLLLIIQRKIKKLNRQIKAYTLSPLRDIHQDRQDQIRKAELEMLNQILKEYEE